MEKRLIKNLEMTQTLRDRAMYLKRDRETCIIGFTGFFVDDALNAGNNLEKFLEMTWETYDFESKIYDDLNFCKV